MLASFLMGLVGGQRAMTPLAAVSLAATAGRLPARKGAARLLARPLVAAGAIALAIGEMAGDKLKSAPDRTVPIGLTARFITSAIAGAALVPHDRQGLGAAVGGCTTVVAAYPGWRTRMASMQRHSQMSTGLFEDAVVVLAAAVIVSVAPRLTPRFRPTQSSDTRSSTRPRRR